MEVGGQFHDPAALSPRETNPVTHCIGGWVGPRAGLDIVKKSILFLPEIEPQILGRSARSLVDIPSEIARFF
jgi:hypothetical protein